MNNLTSNIHFLKLSNVLNNLFVNKNDLNLPTIVAVGSQSSGKSSVLNGLLGVDILPTGNNMVTRIPIKLELQQSDNENVAIFGKYINGIWNTLKIFQFNYPKILPSQKEKISNFIEEITIENAGDNMNISKKEIFLKIKGKYIPNLNLIDLPGLTMVACTDKGQPPDIKKQIKEMIGNYIKNKNTIILAVMPARTDIEADIALDLIKDYDPKGDRTLGVLTKVDLMNEGTNISQLLQDNISIDLKLNYGYFGVKNRSKKEMEQYSALEGINIEQDYFKNHSVYSKYLSKVGKNNLSISIKNI